MCLESLQELALSTLYKNLISCISRFLESQSSNQSQQNFNSHLDDTVSEQLEDDEADQSNSSEREENPAKKTKLDTSTSSSSEEEIPIQPSLTRKVFVASIRETLKVCSEKSYAEQHLKIRQKLNEKLLESYVNGKEYHLLFRRLYFNRILDGSFTDLNITYAALDCDSSLIVKSIVHLCPQLEKLTIGWPSDCGTNYVEKTGEELCRFANVLLELKSLTSLTGLWDSENVRDKESLQFYTILGTSCSTKLTHLEVEGLPFGIGHLFALMFGKKKGLLSNSLFTVIQQKSTESEGDLLHRVQFYQESLSPICRSLQKFTTVTVSNREESECFMGESSTLAFIYRHFPNLVEFDQCCSHYGDYSGLGHPRVKSLKALNKLYRSAFLQDENAGEILTQISSSVSLGFIGWHLNSPFVPSSLAPFSDLMEYVGTKDIAAVAKLCPHLKTIVLLFYFTEKNYCKESNVEFTAEKLGRILSNLSELQDITFVRCSPSFRQTVLSILDSQLLSIQFNGYCVILFGPI